MSEYFVILCVWLKEYTGSCNERHLEKAIIEAESGKEAVEQFEKLWGFRGYYSELMDIRKL